jgi:hypothetical protein
MPLERKSISDCEEITRVIESLSDDNFRKWFTYFADNNIESEAIYFENNDFIRFEINQYNLLDNSQAEKRFRFPIFIKSPRILTMEKYYDLDIHLKN